MPENKFEELKMWAITKLQARAARLMSRRFVLFPVLRARILLSRADRIIRIGRES